MVAAVPVLLATMAVSLLLLKYAAAQKAGSGSGVPRLKCAGVASPPTIGGGGGGTGASSGPVAVGGPRVSAGGTPEVSAGGSAGGSPGPSAPASPPAKDGASEPAAALENPGASEPAAALANPAASEPAPLLAEGQITKPDSKIELECPEGHTFLPPIQTVSRPKEGKGTVQSVYLDVRGVNSEELLQTAIPGATGTEATATNVVILEITQLPNRTKTIYLHCAKYETKPAGGGKGRTAEKEPVCAFAVTVASPPPQGPQSCAVPGTTVQLGIPGEGAATRFKCGADLDLSPDDDEKKKAYSEDCVTEVDLKGMTLTHADDSQWYVLKATKKPPKKTICYLCESDFQSSGEDKRCTIKIALRGSSRLTARPVIGVALPFVLVLLHFA